MTLSVSTRFKERLFGPEAIEALLNGGRIVGYTGARPATPDDPVAGVAVFEVSRSGIAWAPGNAGGLMYARTGSWLSKVAADSWVLRGLATGAPTWFRVYGAASDPGDLSYAHVRIDGDVGTDFVIPTSTVTVATSVPVEQFLFTLPPVIGA